MRRPARLTSSLALVAMTATAFAAASSSAPAVAASDGACDAPADAQSFEMAYIDTARAGGEPIITRHPDGQLLWGSHAGTTHFYSPSAASPNSAAFAENYEGQTYYYVSDDNEAWDFVPRTPVSGLGAVVGAPATGFSDPEVDEVAAALTVEGDEAVRTQLTNDLQVLFAERLPFITLLYPDGAYAYNSDVYDDWEFVAGQGIVSKLSMLPPEARP